MSFKNEKSYITRFIELSMSSNQTIVSTSGTLVNFDEIRGDNGHEVSLVSGGNGTIRLKANRYYYIYGSATMDKDSETDQYNIKWYYTNGSQVTNEEGGFATHKSYQSGTTSYSQCLYCQLLVNPSSDTDYQLKVDGETGNLLKDGTMLFITEMSIQ